MTGSRFRRPGDERHSDVTRQPGLPVLLEWLNQDAIHSDSVLAAKTRSGARFLMPISYSDAYII